MENVFLCTCTAGSCRKKIISKKHLASLITEDFDGSLCPLLIKSLSIHLNAGIKILTKCFFDKAGKIFISLFRFLPEICFCSVFQPHQIRFTAGIDGKFAECNMISCKAVPAYTSVPGLCFLGHYIIIKTFFVIHEHEPFRCKPQETAGFLKILYLNFIQRFHGYGQALCITDNLLNSQEFQHFPDKICQKFPGFCLFACYLNGFPAPGDPVKIIQKDTAFFPCKIFCFQTYGIIILFFSSAKTGGSLILGTSYFYRKRPGFLCFSVKITDLRIFFSKIYSNDQISCFIHL